jgi:hypothetical protein
MRNNGLSFLDSACRTAGVIACIGTGRWNIGLHPKSRC